MDSSDSSDSGVDADREIVADAVDVMANSLSGILRLGDSSQGSSISQGSDSSQGYDFIPAKTYTWGRGMWKLDRPKSKKKVTFQSEEHLENIVEISPRPDSPLYEEMEPCDPDKLLHYDIYSSGYTVNDNGTGNKRTDSLARINGILGFRATSNMAPSLASIRKIHPRKTVTRDHPNVSTTRRGSQTNNGYQSDDVSSVSKRIRSAPPGRREQFHNTNNGSSQSPMEQRLNRSTSTGVYGRPRSASHRGRPNLTEDQRSTVRAKSLANKRELITSNLSINRARGSQLSHSAGPLHARTHQSPYRSGTTGRALGTIRPNDTPVTPTLSVTGARIEAYNIVDKRVMSAPPVSARKIYAWQEANSAMKSNNMMVSEPCISQLWNSPRTTVDSLYGPKCS